MLCLRDGDVSGAWGKEMTARLPIKCISSPHKTGDIHLVQKLGIDAERTPYIDIDGKRWRLPGDLLPWALSTLNLREIEFPCKVEFSVLNGRTCADFVIGE